MGISNEILRLLDGLGPPWILVILVAVTLARQAPQIIRELKRKPPELKRKPRR
jgi:hypothetical protein